MGVVYSNFVIKEDGTLWACGYNNNGQLGLGDTNNKTTFTKVGNDNDWMYVNGNSSFNFAIKKDGSLWGCGNNNHGQLGVGDTNNKTTFTKVGSDKWKMISSGASSSVAIREDGTLWAWGHSQHGLTGISQTTVLTSSPRKIGTDEDWVMVQVGYSSALAIKRDGSLWSWGESSYGELGIGNSQSRIITPQKISSERWKYIACGQYMSSGIKEDGTLWAWGKNTEGNLSVGDRVNKTLPTQVGSKNKWKKVRMDSDGMIALDDDGIIWVKNSNNSLSEVDNNKWMDIVKLNNGYMCVRKGGTLWAWGDNSYGQLGLEDTANRDVATKIDISNVFRLSDSDFELISNYSLLFNGGRIKSFQKKTLTEISENNLTEKLFRDYGSELDFKIKYTQKRYINQTSSTPLGEGKIFTQPLDLEKYEINKIRFK